MLFFKFWLLIIKGIWTEKRSYINTRLNEWNLNKKYRLYAVQFYCDTDKKMCDWPRLHSNINT